MANSLFSAAVFETLSVNMNNIFWWSSICLLCAWCVCLIIISYQLEFQWYFSKDFCHFITILPRHSNFTYCYMPNKIFEYSDVKQFSNILLSCWKFERFDKQKHLIKLNTHSTHTVQTYWIFFVFLSNSSSIVNRSI